MSRSVDESVGENFSVDLLQGARDKTLEVIMEAASEMRPGMSESDARSVIRTIQKKKGSPKAWHPPQVRFGENTVLSFGKKGAEDAVLKDDDIFFFDLGPLFDGHEGDVGRTFAVGSDPDFIKCSQDVEVIWNLVRDHWKKTGATGRKLYAYASQCAEERGWVLSLRGASGHRVADFPHTAGVRGTIEGLERKPAPDRWILEIQIRHPERPFGAFYEDLLS